MKNIILILCLFTTINILAEFHFGVKAGVNYNDVDIITTQTRTKYNDINYNGGLFLIKSLNEYLYLSIETLYNRKGFNSVIKIENEKDVDAQVVVEYFEIPILLGIKYDSLYFYSGLYFAKYINSNYKCNENTSIYCGDNNGIYDSILKSSDTGIIIGAGYQFKKFLFDLRYSKGITEINEMPGDREYSSGIDNFYQFIFSVGFMFK